MTTRAEVLYRFPLLHGLSAARIRRFEQALTTLRPSDNREQRRQAAQNIINRLQLPLVRVESMLANLMVYQDGTRSRNTTHRDSHTPARKRRRTASVVAPPTPEPQEELHAGDNEEDIIIDENDTVNSPDQGTALPRRPLLPTPDGTPSRTSSAPLQQTTTGAETNDPPSHGRPSASSGLALENGMLRAQLSEIQSEVSELQLALARSHGEAMAERERRRRLVREIRTRVDEED